MLEKEFYLERLRLELSLLGCGSNEVSVSIELCKKMVNGNDLFTATVNGHCKGVLIGWAFSFFFEMVSDWSIPPMCSFTDF